MKRRIISSLLTLIMAVGIIGSISVGAVEYGVENQNMPVKTYTQKFSDVPSSHWGFSYIGEMVERGVLNGYPDGRYYPENTVTRAEFAKIMTVSARLPIYQPGYQYFDDVAIEEWYAPYIHSAYPFLSGYEYDFGRYYRPDVPALREDIAVALVKLKGYATLEADESILDAMFIDTESISDSARIYVATAIERGLVSGYEDRTFRGQDSITRAEAAAMLWRAYQYGDDNKVFDEEITAGATAPQTTTVPNKIIDDIQKTEAPIVEEVYDYGIVLSKDRLTVDENDTAEITITISDESPAGVDIDKIDFDYEEWSVSDDTYKNKLIIDVVFDTDTSRKEDYTFRYKDKAEKFALVVNEVQEYTWKVETVAKKTDFIRERIGGDGTSGSSKIVYNLIEAKDGVLYSDKTYLYYTASGSEEILNVNDIEWQGEEMSKKYELSQSINAYAYNYNDDNIYAVISQYCGGDRYNFLYNVSEQEVVYLIEKGTSIDYIFGFYSNGAMETSEGKVVDGHLIKNSKSTSLNMYWVYDDSFYKHEYNSVEGPFIWYELKKFNLSTNEFEEIDVDDDKHYDYASQATGCLYKTENKSIIKMDLNGDSEKLLDYSEVRVDDSCEINEIYPMYVDSNEDIYFYDGNYESIRRISRIE